MVKSRLYADDVQAAWTLHRIVRDYMSALSPVCPFFTHHISSTVYETSAVDIDAFPTYALPDLHPESEEAKQFCALSASLQEFNSQTWATKKERGISLNQPVSGIELPQELAAFQSTLTRMHQLE